MASMFILRSLLTLLGRVIVRHLNLRLTPFSDFLDVTESGLPSSVGKQRPPELQPDVADLRPPRQRGNCGELTFIKSFHSEEHFIQIGSSSPHSGPVRLAVR